MAAGTFKWYRRAVGNILAQSMNLETGVVRGLLMTDGFTGNTKSHSILTQVLTEWATASSTKVNSFSIPVPAGSSRFTQSSRDTIAFKGQDVNGFTAGGGDTINSAKYLLLVLAAVSATADTADKLIGFCDLNTDAADASVGQSVQVNVTWTGNTIGKIRTNP